MKLSTSTLLALVASFQLGTTFVIQTRPLSDKNVPAAGLAPRKNKLNIDGPRYSGHNDNSDEKRDNFRPIVPLIVNKVDDSLVTVEGSKQSHPGSVASDNPSHYIISRRDPEARYTGMGVSPKQTHNADNAKAMYRREVEDVDKSQAGMMGVYRRDTDDVDKSQAGMMGVYRRNEVDDVEKSQAGMMGVYRREAEDIDRSQGGMIGVYRRETEDVDRSQGGMIGVYRRAEETEVDKSQGGMIGVYRREVEDVDKSQAGMMGVYRREAPEAEGAKDIDESQAGMIGVYRRQDNQNAQAAQPPQPTPTTEEPPPMNCFLIPPPANRSDEAILNYEAGNPLMDSMLTPMK